LRTPAVGVECPCDSLSALSKLNLLAPRRVMSRLLLGTPRPRSRGRALPRGSSRAPEPRREVVPHDRVRRRSGSRHMRVTVAGAEGDGQATTCACGYEQ